MTGLEAGSDGRPRCGWSAGSPDYEAYHDDEWGWPVTDEAAMFERLTLEAFQSGLSWLTILRRREGFREAFARFRIAEIAEFGEEDVARLLADTRIIRNRAKIEATIANARAARQLAEEGGSLATLAWSYRADGRPAPETLADLNPTTPASVALAKELKRLGFRFVGPTTAYALMEATGIVNDHLAGCWVREAVEEARRRVALQTG